MVKLKASLRKFYGRHHDLVDCYEISVSQMTTDMFYLSYVLFKISSMLWLTVLIMSQMTTDMLRSS